MRLEPGAAHLLTLALAILRERLLPALPDAAGGDAQTVAHALALGIDGSNCLASVTERPATSERLEKLAAAAAMLRERLLALLPEPRRYDARLVAKAIAVARRELEFGDAPPQEELARLAGLFEEAPPAVVSAAELRNALTTSNARLCAEIRSGNMDDERPKSGAVRAFLEHATRAVVRESHPEYLCSQARTSDR